MMDYLAYLWARDVTEESVGDRTSVMSEVLDLRSPRPRRGRARVARALRTAADRLEPAMVASSRRSS
jgi:hypothetical protein